MKSLKVDDYIQRTTSEEQTEQLHRELEDYIKSGPGLHGRTLSDRIIRACNHQLGSGHLRPGHVNQLVKLVELSLRVYDLSADLFSHNIPLYMEKILFHLVKNLSSQEAFGQCSSVAGLLWDRLAAAQQGEQYTAILRSCFSVLWSGLSADKVKKTLNPQERFLCQVQALSFLLLLDSANETPSSSKVLVYTEYAAAEFEGIGGGLSQEGANAVVRKLRSLYDGHCTGRQDLNGEGSKQKNKNPGVYVFCEMLLVVVKMLCKAGHHNVASAFLKETSRKVAEVTGCECTALVLGKLAVEVHSSMRAGTGNGQALTNCARALRSTSVDLEDQEARAVLQGCDLVVWAVEHAQKEAFGAADLLAWFSFLEEHQEWMVKLQGKVVSCNSEKLQQTLCFSLYQGVVFAYESLQASRLENDDDLHRVLLYCKATAGKMMTELHKLPSESLLTKAVIAVSNLVCGLYNRHQFDQAFQLAEIVCRDLCRSSPVSLSVDRLSRPFMLAVQTSRKAGHLEQALDWVIQWLKALGDKILTHMAEPISLWVKIKIDAARSSEDDVRLRTLRDGFGPDVPGEEVMLSLLEEELRGYKEVAGDTSSERYNALCDLLDICHEDGPHTHLRAVYLCEMAQVVCFQDFSEQTDCSAVDFTHEALRLLEEEPVTAENVDRLKDNKARVLLWLYICTLEKNLQEAVDKAKKIQEQKREANPVGANDFDYEAEQKFQDNFQVYHGLQFNLASEHKMCKPLERALSEWTALLKGGALPSVRNPKQTCSSIALTAALFRLMGKPLKALEAYQLSTALSRLLSDPQQSLSSLSQSASVLLDLGAPDLALVQLQRAEEELPSEPSGEGPSSLSVLVLLLKAQYYYSTGKVAEGVPLLCEVLKKVNESRQSKSWYLLRARALQTCSAYLNLDTAVLPQAERRLLAQHGFSSPDSTLYESLKLLCSLLVTLVGKGLYGTNDGSSDVRFIDQGDNLLVKWQLLSDLLSCSVKMVSVRSSCGAINDARLQCLEALKLANKLHAPGQCAELLVMKAELELVQGESGECGSDLTRVADLLDRCTDFSDPVQKAEVKIKLRKGRPAQPAQPSPPAAQDDYKDILKTRWPTKEPIPRNVSGSPPLKSQPRRWLSSLEHVSDCQCPCCSEPSLGHATARWAATQANLLLSLDANNAKVGLKLQWATISRCHRISEKVASKLAQLFPSTASTTSSVKPALMQGVVGRVYLDMALSGLEPRLSSVCGIWKVLDAGLAYVDSMTSPALRPVRAGLMSVKAIVSLMRLASKKACHPEELFSNAWTWNPPKELKSEHKTTDALKQSKDQVRNPEEASKTKEPKKTRAAKPRIQAPTSSSTRGKASVPMTPVAVRSKPAFQEPSCFDFNTAVPTLAFTPVQKVKHAAAASTRKAPRTASKKQFHIFEDTRSPTVIVPAAPAAPRRVKKSRFKVEFSDESDSEATETKDVPKKTPATRRTAKAASAVPDFPAEKRLPKRPTRGKRSTAAAQVTSSEDDACLPVSTRRGRGRKEAPRKEAEELEELDKMRSVEEEEEELNGVLDVSVEELRTSDNDLDGSPASNLEILRRDVCGLDTDGFTELKTRGHVTEGPQTQLSDLDTRTEDLYLEEVQALLHSAWLTLKHFPNPNIFPILSSLLALALGQKDPAATAMLHAQSLGVTSRHRTIRHLANCLKKLRKSSGELSDKMNALSLKDAESKSTAEQRLTLLENVFSFPAADSSSFPEGHRREFLEQLQHLPSGVTVCMMSVFGLKPGEMGDGVLLSRLEKGSDPVTVRIPTSKMQRPVSWLVQELDSILVQQKAVSCVTEKATWWEGRRALDSRVEHLLMVMEEILGCWKSFLLPSPPDPQLSTQTQHLGKRLAARGLTCSEEMLKAVLSAFPTLSQEDVQSFGLGVSPRWDEECEQLLRSAASELSKTERPGGHVVLILDKYLQKLPWESVSCLRSHSVSRMPSLHSLLGLNIQKETDAHSILKHGVDTKKVFYVLDPDANLGHSRDQFKEWFCSRPDWEGVCGVAPASSQLEEAVATKDLYIYVGHGAGSRFLDSQMILKQQMRAASLLFGCSSAALAVRGNQEGQGIILSYLIAGCPFILGNLWDVTDRDIDRFTKALLESWLSAGPGASLLQYMSQSRQATHLKHLIGAAPVVYGLPVHLQ